MPTQRKVGPGAFRRDAVWRGHSTLEPFDKGLSAASSAASHSGNSAIDSFSRAIGREREARFGLLRRRRFLYGFAQDGELVRHRELWQRR